MSEKLLDYREALERLGGDQEFLKELLTELVSQVDENIENLKQAVRDNNYSNLKSLSHSLKGASANLNVTRMAAHFYELENLGANGKTNGANEFINLVIEDRNALEDFLLNGIPAE